MYVVCIYMLSVGVCVYIEIVLGPALSAFPLRPLCSLADPILARPVASSPAVFPSFSSCMVLWMHTAVSRFMWVLRSKLRSLHLHGKDSYPLSRLSSSFFFETGLHCVDLQA